jgi:uncharacterized protein
MSRLFLHAIANAFLILACTVGLAAQSDTSVDAQKTAVIGQLLDATHAADQVLNVMEAGLPAMRQATSDVPAIFWDRFVDQARARRHELLAALVPLYARTFELSELEALVQFYRSPLGQRLIDVQPALARDSMQVGQSWGARIGAEVGRQLEKEGVRLPTR